MGTNKMTRDTKSSLVAQLEAKIEELVASINKLAQKATQTTASIADIDAAMTKATQERQAEKEKNQATLKDSQAAQAATQNAMAVLKTYYEAAANQPEPLPEAEGPIKYDPRSLVILSKATGARLFRRSRRSLAPPRWSRESTRAR